MLVKLNVKHSAAPAARTENSKDGKDSGMYPAGRGNLAMQHDRFAAVYYPISSTLQVPANPLWQLASLLKGSKNFCTRRLLAGNQTQPDSAAQTAKGYSVSAVAATKPAKNESACVILGQ
jgi:hypothetical protein